MGTVTRSDGPSAGQAHTLHMQRPMNLFMRGMLRTPGLAQLVGRRFLTLYVVGRKTGKQYCVPAAYIRHEGSLLLGTQFGWGRNLRTGEPLDVRYQGRRRVADVVVIQDE